MTSQNGNLMKYGASVHIGTFFGYGRISEMEIFFDTHQNKNILAELMVVVT